MHVSEAVKHAGGSVSLKGWVHRKRESGGILFIVLRDSTGMLQTAVKKDKVDARSWKAAQEATVESSIEVSGRVKKEERAPGGFELEVSKFENVHVSEPFPITEYQSAELLLDKRHLWLRSRRMTEIMKVRSHVFKYLREFLDDNGFYEITSPVITLAGGETGADLFEVDFFGHKAYLTESSQLYAEAMVFSLEKVYSMTPAFRAEKSRTTKHIAELWMVEPEMAFYDWKMNMELQEKLVSHIANKLAKEDEEVLNELKVDRDALLKIRPPFKRITYEKALEIVNEKGSKLRWGDDFGVPEEKMLTEGEKMPIFITSWPKEIKAFSAMVDPKNPRTVLSADMQAPNGHGEIIGGTEREWRLDKVLERMHEIEKIKHVKFNMKNYEWWLELRRYGSVPHSGFGMGMERLIKWLLNLDHIRDAIPFPRMSNRMYP
jgi:asparaginyl-tRNA synthetase